MYKKYLLIFISIVTLFIGCSPDSGYDNPVVEVSAAIDEVIIPFIYEDLSPFELKLNGDGIIKKSIDILSVGDIMGHTIQLQSAYNDDGTYDFSEQFRYISKKIISKDFSIGNFETVMAGEEARYSGKNMIFNAPDNLGLSLKEAGFDILSTSNNHSLDRGFSGLSRTIEVLDKFGLKHAGTYSTEEKSEEILIVEKNNISFAYMAYSYSTNGWPIPSDNPYCIDMMEEEKIIEDIKKAKELDVDIVIVSLHWGLEYQNNPNIHQKRLAESLFYAGADIILGSHPHVLQPFEHKKMIDEYGKEKDKFIIYSMGNFISGQRTYPRDIGMYINFKISKINDESAYVEEVSVMPTWVQYTNVNNKKYMRILDVHDAILKYDLGLLDNFSKEDYNRLVSIESEAIKHLFKLSGINIFELNESNEYIIYKPSTK